jgi:hypothetical protein
VGENGEPFTQGSVRARVIVPAAGGMVTVAPQEEVPFTDQGEAVFNLSAPTITPVDYEKVEIEFTYVKDYEDQGSIRGEWRVRNNSNVKFVEVLRGEAVFVFDDNAGNNHKGVTPANVTDDNERYFDFVQELLNQVVPRKRSVLNYNLLDEQGAGRGIYNNTVAQVIGTFKEHFRVDNVGKPKGDFMKLLTDYNKTEEMETWRNRIVDKYILVGNNQNTAHNLINPSLVEGDTGLYELYQNVVQKFVNSMIRLCESYRDHSSPTNAITGWVSRKNLVGATHDMGRMIWDVGAQGT